MSDVLAKLVAGEDLTETEAEALFGVLTDERTAEDARVDLLGALRDKGETAAEVAAFASAMRKAARDPGLGDLTVGRPVVDLVGTGGDGAQTLNISTAAALLVAASAQGRVLVVKHGNRAISSRSGASDVLTCLGVAGGLSVHASRRLLEATGFTYLHAPHYHPGVAAVATARRRLGTRSIFNLLGPLSNPARPTHGLIGAYSPGAAALMADALSRLEYRRAMVVHTEVPGGGLDEATHSGAFRAWMVEGRAVAAGVRDARVFGLACHGAIDDLRGGGPAENAEAIRAIFAGSDHPARDTVILNAAAALWLSLEREDERACAQLAAEGVKSGRATALLAQLQRLGSEGDHG